MKHSTNVFLTPRRSRRMIISITIALLVMTVLLAASAGCSPYTGTKPQLLIDVTTPVVEDNTPLKIELTSVAVFEHPLTTNANENPHLSNVVIGKAKIAAGMLDYQIKGQKSVSVGENEEVPIGSDVRIWNYDEVVKIELGDGSVIILNPFTSLSINIINPSTRFPIIRIILGRGSTLVVSGNLWIISADSQYRIWLKESKAEVSYEPLQSMINVKCLGMKGSCFFSSSDNSYTLAPGEHLEYNGSIRGKMVILENILSTPTLALTPTLTPTLTLTPTPVITPTEIPTTAGPAHTNPDDTGDDSRRKRKDREGGDGGKGG